MADKPWKKFERTTAKHFLTSRALMKGTAETADIEHPVFEVDCKLRKNWRIAAWFAKLRIAARAKDKIPVLVLRQPTKKLTYVVCELDTFISLAKGAGWLIKPTSIDEAAKADGGDEP